MAAGQAARHLDGTTRSESIVLTQGRPRCITQYDRALTALATVRQRRAQFQLLDATHDYEFYVT